MSTVIIKKYANRKLYIPKGMTEPTGYVNLLDIVNIIRKGKEVRVVDVVTGEDITALTLKLALEYIELSEDLLVKLIRGE